MSYVIHVSFTDEEKWLYDYIKNKSSYSGYVKDILKQAEKNEQNEKQIENDNKQIIKSVLDF